MKIRLFLTGTVFIGAFIGSVYAGSINPVSSPTGTFDVPQDEDYSGPYCSQSGFKLDYDQYHMQWNGIISKYHMGEDWNGMCGDDTDEGYPLRAIAFGKVVYVDDTGNSTKGKQLHIRYSFPYALAPNDVQTFDSVYLHITGINPSEVSFSGSGTGSFVSKGDVVAYLGGTGGTVGWPAHLHWEALWDDSISLTENTYQNPLTVDHALKYRAPSLIVDDRRDIVGHSTPAPGNWYTFTMQGNAPSSTMYIWHNGERKSLRNAIAAGWIPSKPILHERDGTWYYYIDVDNNFFENGKRYAIKTLISGPVFYILIPGNGFTEDRARLDMLHAVENDNGYDSVKTETYSVDYNWMSSFELYQMEFKLSNGDTAYVYQATSKTNPLIRYTSHYDTSSSTYSGWVPVNWNRMY